MVVEEGRDLDQLPSASVFNTPALAPGEGRLPVSKMLNEVSGNRPAETKRPPLVAAHAGFGAQ
jgi:hypothetical protein